VANAATAQAQSRGHGTVGSIFDAVEKLVAAGGTKRAAFEHVAGREGTSVSAVQSAYYSAARTRGGQARARPKEKPLPIDRLTSDLVGCVEELSDLVRAQQAEIEGLQQRMQNLRMLF
jgi:hypothetical protein